MQTTFTRAARLDIMGAFEYLLELNPKAASNTYDEINKFCFQCLSANPYLGHKRPDLPQKYRSFTIRNYVIIYEVLPENISIIRIVHGAKDMKALNFT